MDAAYRPPNILRLSGISLKDYVSADDLFDKKLLSEADELPIGDSIFASDIPWDKIPKTFTKLEDWPLSTNLKCWDMDCTFSDVPKFVPTFVVENENGDLEFGVKGNFATFNNVALWIENHYPDREERLRTLDMLCLVYKLFTGITVSHIEPAPEKEKKIQYGGEWDDETYWRKLRELDPIAGLKDHTLGSVKTEREKLSHQTKARLEPSIPYTTVWSLCSAGASGKTGGPLRILNKTISTPTIASRSKVSLTQSRLAGRSKNVERAHQLPSSSRTDSVTINGHNNGVDSGAGDDTLSDQGMLFRNPEDALDAVYESSFIDAGAAPDNVHVSDDDLSELVGKINEMELNRDSPVDFGEDLHT